MAVFPHTALGPDDPDLDTEVMRGGHDMDSHAFIPVFMVTAVPYPSKLTICMHLSP